MVKTLWGMVLLWTLVIEDGSGRDLEASRKMVTLIIINVQKRHIM